MRRWCSGSVEGSCEKGVDVVHGRRVGLWAAVVSVVCMVVGCTEAERSSDGDVERDVGMDVPAAVDSAVDATVDGSELDAGEDVDSDVGVHPCPADLAGVIDETERRHPERMSDDYRVASSMQVSALTESVSVGLAGNLETAIDRAERAGYRVCAFDGQKMLAWYPREPTEGGAVAVVRTAADAAELVVEAPHPFFEFNTLEEARAIFRRVNARGMLISGTHRCANSEASACDGETAVCGEQREAYRVSDMAHTTTSYFQAMHRALVRHDEESMAISLHGFSDDGVSLSDGTTLPSDAAAPVAELGEAIAGEFPEIDVTYCNEIPGRTREIRLCGTTNVQGRHLNRVAEACRDDANASSGRFIHLEQSLSVRQEAGAIADAVEAWWGVVR